MKKFAAEVLILSLIIPAVFHASAFAETKTYSSTYFRDITLTEPIPKNFFRNEVYVIEGKITSGNHETVTVILQKVGTTRITTFSGPVTNKNFSIPVFFSQAGSFYLGIIRGEEGKSKAVNIKVKTSLPIAQNLTTPPIIDSLDIGYKNDRTSIDMDTDSPSLKRITFVQGNKKASYISRQNMDLIPINYIDFENFLPGKVSFYAEVAAIKDTAETEITSEFTKSDARTFTAMEHTFTDINTKAITANPPDTIRKIGRIYFSGKAGVDIELAAYVIRPDGKVDTLDLQTSGETATYSDTDIIKKGGSFTFSYSPEKRGRYILEISDKEGIPILNHPTYIGTGIPLIPDFFDLNERELSQETSDIQILRKELLDLINQERRKQNLPELTMTTELNNLAQKHSEDMASNNYFSHINLKNQSPEDRRIAMGIPTPVSENIARDTSMEFAHNGLMRSGSHRKNILQKDWTTVGMGITQKNGYLHITEEFSPSALNFADLENKKTELFTAINTERKLKGLPILTYSPSLELVSKKLNEKNTSSDINNDTLSETLDEYGIGGDTMVIGRSYSSWGPILESLLSPESEIFEKDWKTIGIDIQTDDIGIIVTLIALNKP